MKLKPVVLSVLALAPVVALAQGVKDQEAIKEAEKGIASVLNNHINSDTGLNHPVCDDACKDHGAPTKDIPKAEWSKITASVDWASFKGKTDAQHGIAFIGERCERIIMGLSELGEYGSGDHPGDQVAYRKAMREQIKSVRCRYDTHGQIDKNKYKWPVLSLKNGVYTGGFDFEETGESMSAMSREWLKDHL
jgi:hypothetical protein